MTTQSLVYLDHNATTPMKPAVRETMLEVLGFPGNASSVHKAGRDARRKIEDARASILKLVNAGPKAVLIFTSGATEANNLALKGAMVERVLVSAIEHPSVLYAHNGAEIIPVLPSGIVDLDALDRMLDGNTRQTLISVMLANNETGVIQPIGRVMEIAKRHGVLVHCDAVQAAGKIDVDLQKLGVDFLTLSAHKIGGPQGAGCLILSNCVSVSPQMRGGNQEKNMRGGTENLAGIVGFGKATELAAKDLNDFQKLSSLRDKIEKGLKEIAPELVIFGTGSPRLTNTLMFAVEGMASETQMIALDLAGICVSNGSACSSGTVKASHVLKAMGVSETRAASSLRVSLGWNTAEEDVDFLIAKWEEMYKRIKERKAAHA